MCASHTFPGCCRNAASKSVERKFLGGCAQNVCPQFVPMGTVDMWWIAKSCKFTVHILLPHHDIAFSNDLFCFLVCNAQQNIPLFSLPMIHMHNTLPWPLSQQNRSQMANGSQNTAKWVHPISNWSWILQNSGWMCQFVPHITLLWHSMQSRGCTHCCSGWKNAF